MSLHVVQPGLETRVVDLGRHRFRSLGVSVGGAADRTSLALGNALVGNPPDAPALEICLQGPTLRAACPLACVLFGAPFEMTCGRRKIAAETTFMLEEGEEAHIFGTPLGARAYFCVAGGFRVPRVLESSSSLTPLRAGEELPCAPSKIHGRFLSPSPPVLRGRGAGVRGDARAAAWPPHPPPLSPEAGERGERTLHVLPGLQESWFQSAEFYAQHFAVRPASNRMGLRLQGAPLTMPPQELVSEPVCPGAVQVTRDGQCIVLGIDGQTIGGYPKIAQVISADLDALGQLRPGDRLRFLRIGIDEAVALYRRKQAQLHEWVLRLRLALDGFSRRA